MLLFCFRILESTHKGVNYRPKYVIQIQQRPESTTVTFTWHACKCKVHELHQRYTLFEFFNWTGGVGLPRFPLSCHKVHMMPTQGGQRPQTAPQRPLLPLAVPQRYGRQRPHSQRVRTPIQPVHPQHALI